jgi:prepilin-type N-terminal cleavage/methylation domain-containing protein
MKANPKPRHRIVQAPRSGLSLIEVLITLAVISILAGVLIPQLQADIPDRLVSVGQIVAADIEYARSLAVANNSKYRFQFSTSANKYYLEHSGTSSILEALPSNPFRPSDDEIDEQTTALEDLPIGKPQVELIGVLRMSGAGMAVTDLEFTANGATTRTESTVIWLGCGSGEGRRFLPLTVNATTGLVEVGEVTTQLPTGLNDVSFRSNRLVNPSLLAVAEGYRAVGIEGAAA